MNRGREALFKNPTKDAIRRLGVLFRVWLKILPVLDLLKIAVHELAGLRRLVSVRPKALSRSLWIRTLSTDVDVLRYVLHDGFHLPPAEAELTRQPVILDLGCNIGLTIAHFKTTYAESIVYGYEMNRENYLLAQKNLETYDGVVLWNKAVWVEDCLIEYHRSSDPDSHSIRARGRTGLVPESVEAVSLDTVMRENGLSRVDFLKMDIEGAEQNILENKNLRWLTKVNALNLELHCGRQEREKTIAHYIDLLEHAGFKAWKDNRHFASILAVRLRLNKDEKVRLNE
jgi:FkbM family methyltransferase